MFGLNDDETARLIYLGLLLALLVMGMGFGGRRRGSVGAYARQLTMWALIILGLVAVYAYREPLTRLAAPILNQLDPSRVVQVTGPDGARELVVSRGSDGHFHIDADADGRQVNFLVDTGASDTILAYRDAQRIGLDPASLRFDRPVQTANGVAYYARAKLESLQVGPFRLSSVPVGVLPADAIDTSLLGMSTINRFKGWRVEGDRMVLVP